MNLLGNYVNGQWIPAEKEGIPLFHAITGEAIAVASAQAPDSEAILDYGRKTGGKVLQKMTFQQRGEMLKKLALFLTRNKEKYYEVSYMTGATRADSWIDIEGGFGNLFANASLRRQFPNLPYHVDGDPVDLSRGGSFMGHHIMVPRQGVAIHINAFNFPVWGMLEKCAVNWMAGVPAVVKPATATSYLTEAVVRDIVASGILPEGALQLICGPARNLLDGVGSQDVVTFTGSAATGRMLKANSRILDEAVPFTMEADSLNCSVLGPDARPGTPEFDLFVKEVRKEMTVKCGQKCTAIRRILVPENMLEDVQIALGRELAKTVLGDPALKEVRMGALVSRGQADEVRGRVRELMKTARLAYGDPDKAEPLGEKATSGAFMSPLLLVEEKPFQNVAVHEIEAFGPVSTLMPYRHLDEAVELARMGKGSLCCSIATFDEEAAREFVVGAASHHGRILVLNRENARQSTGHGSPLPTLIHGGPGRAGGGEEMGGMRGVMHYLQRCAIQGTPDNITRITGIYQTGARKTEAPLHPFRYHFEDIQPGMSLTTHRRTVTDSDIINFANLTWDHFYAHTDITSLEGSIFEKRAAHGYFILAAAAGLFVYPNKGPVAANYGLEECRFLRPVYHNDTLYVTLTCKEKRERDAKGREFPAGVVKWQVEVFDAADERVALATILTLVQKKNPFLEFSRDEIMPLLSELRSDTPALWGKMTAQHMVEHLVFHFRTALGQLETRVVTPPEQVEKLQESLWNFRAMPRDFRHPLLNPDGPGNLEFAGLPEALAGLDALWTEYISYYAANPDARHPNAVFGLLDKWHWDLLGRKHFDHHLRQFGLLRD
jgi:oxepin-CoA hydrolase/3-oxo-5,6-dehydrosuberyl-CoA semialdehyde dehydrogenase